VTVKNTVGSFRNQLPPGDLVLHDIAADSRFAFSEVEHTHTHTHTHAASLLVRLSTHTHTHTHAASLLVRLSAHTHTHTHTPLRF